MNILRPLVIALACLSPLLATAQWQWLDKDGKKVFSDRPPPSDIPANRVLKAPAGAPPAAAADAAPAGGTAAAGASAGTVAAGAPAASGPVPKLSGTDKTLEDKKKQAEAAEAAKKKAAEEQQAALKADNCKRAKANKASLDSGQRLAKINEKGEKDFMSDQERASETKRIEGIIARDCV